MAQYSYRLFRLPAMQSVLERANLIELSTWQWYTSLYVHDLETSERFYTDVLKLRVHSRTPCRDVFLKAGRSMLLLFNPVFLREEAVREGKNAIPQVYEHGRTHIAFEIERGSLDDWARRLEEKGVRITHRETWDTGSRSVYFEDPDGDSASTSAGERNVNSMTSRSTGHLRPCRNQREQEQSDEGYR